MVISDSTWSWPVNVRQLRDISLACEGIPIGPSDSLDWKFKGRSFSFKAAWEAIRVHHPAAPWAKTVWFPGAIPRHSFCLWLTFHKAHSTLDLLQRLGIVQTSQCPFNCGHDESINHLFFECSFTKAVWVKVLKLNNCPTPTTWNWESTARWALGRTKGKQFHRWMRRIGLAASIYHCWRERNNRIFRQSVASPSRVEERICFDVGSKAAFCRNILDSPTNRAIADNWNIDGNIFKSTELGF
ncbi:zf-RVT domain-containing protein [Cephalotus follicularis]|uniref:Zf-RVT domain-containing protein n=1 Tax=Cephalotus follicularis TaxID=3775 RepID=A0A1Q3BBV2_CEPFO|nr:zf-RVT domain-containing protein [Cephalotus follicularis]